jgi:site-specific DNA recombinase
MRAAIYARVSSEEQVEGYSLDAQLRAGRSFVAEHQWSLHREYVEEGRSAHTDDIKKRPVFKEAIEDALAGKYDVLLVHKIDRFSRKLRFTLEYFDRLYKAGVGFVSVSEQMDFTTPTGQVFLAMVGAFSQFYSDNLSQETKKGWAERKAQGLYCGLVPFGVIKGEDGLPAPHPDTYPGLAMAFHMAVEGKSDREIAMALNAAGYRTAGNQGNRLFGKDTVKGILQNRFYVGELSDGNGGRIRAKHEALVPLEVFEAAQRARELNRNHPARTTRADARVSSLSGVARCASCGATLRSFRSRNVTRLVCNTKLKNGECRETSARLDGYEEQLGEYLAAFRIPKDYQERLLEAHRVLGRAYDDAEIRRARLEAALQRLKDLYQWGHKSRQEYLTECEVIQRELGSLRAPTNDGESLEKLAAFLNDVGMAWAEADQTQRNRLALSLFEAVWIQNQRVLAVTPRPELRPFFDLQYEGVSQNVLHWRPRGDSNPRSPA